jgi:hypothetical protein
MFEYLLGIKFMKPYTLMNPYRTQEHFNISADVNTPVASAALPLWYCWRWMTRLSASSQAQTSIPWVSPYFRVAVSISRRVQ